MTRLNAKKRYPDLETTNGECALFFRIYKMVHTVISLSVPAGEISTEQGCEQLWRNYKAMECTLHELKFSYSITEMLEYASNKAT